MPKGEISQDIKDTCGTNKQCILDYFITGDASFAGKTKSNMELVDNLEAIAKNAANSVFCVDLPTILFGKWKAPSLKAGSLATVTCDSGAEHEGCTKMKCDANGAWVFHDCTYSSSQCYGSAVNIGGITPNQGNGNNPDNRSNAQANAHIISAPGKSIQEVVGTAGEAEFSTIAQFILALLIAF